MAILIDTRRCAAPRCNRKHHAGGLCHLHYRRQQRNGNGGLGRWTMSRNGYCAALGCLTSIFARGRCQKHYVRMRVRAAA
jgi:hypothetical protein